MNKPLLIFCFLLVAISAWSQTTFPVNGVSDTRPGKYAIVNAIVHPQPGESFEKGIILINQNKVEKVGVGLSIPNDYVQVDLKGNHIYAGLIDSYSNYGMPEVKEPEYFSYYNTQFNSKKDGPYAWNQAIKAEVNAAELYQTQKNEAEKLRSLGFTTAWVHHPDGIVRGTGAVVAIANRSEQEDILKPQVSRHFSFDKGSSAQSYPISLMGSVALLRQTYLDAEWYNQGGSNKETNLSLAAFNNTRNLPAVFESRDVLDILRAHTVAQEFNENYIIKGNGDEYKKKDWVKEIGATLILPINFPKPVDLEDPLEADLMLLSEMKHWDWAPSNPKVLQDAGVRFTITPHGSGSDFYTNLSKAIQRGLTEDEALAALTTTPASLLNMEDKLGKIQRNGYANFVVTSQPIFSKGSERLETWVMGERFSMKPLDTKANNFKFNFKVPNFEPTYTFETKLKDGKASYHIYENDSVKVSSQVSIDDDYMLIKMNLADSVVKSRLSGFILSQSKIQGQGVHPDGSEFKWEATNVEILDPQNEVKQDSLVSPEPLSSITFPFTSYGNSELPTASDYLIKNATVWTNEAQGIVPNTDVRVSGGQIKEIGQNLEPSGATVIDGTGKHLTSGIIDEHSHIALFSINEVQTVSAHVRQSDVVNSEDINIYRQLAGGVTTSQLLHGSADCIGGQSAIVKLKWGASPYDMQIPDADRFIKFALGENVKRGNAPNYPNRFPVTRMGVEQVYYDAFAQAKEYKRKWEAYEALKSKIGVAPPRRDLTQEALVDILDSKLFITCHSYVQSEINMLMHVADSLGFRVNTFTHILEGYKVADKMKVHGAYGSTFSDWWAYKMEVKEAIPYNAALMTKAGVTTAINSDDAEMARRLNQEAAKTILYGGLTEEEAWKTVTLNPAKMLHLDDRIGSIKEGKDADLVLWSHNPLEVYAIPEFTMIEGAIYFDQQTYNTKKEQIAKEKAMLIKAMAGSKEKKTKIYKQKTGETMHLHCESIVEYGGVSIEEFEENFIKK